MNLVRKGVGDAKAAGAKDLHTFVASPRGLAQLSAFVILVTAEPFGVAWRPQRSEVNSGL